MKKSQVFTLLRLELKLSADPLASAQSLFNSLFVLSNYSRWQTTGTISTDVSDKKAVNKYNEQIFTLKDRKIILGKSLTCSCRLSSQYTYPGDWTLLSGF